MLLPFVLVENISRVVKTSPVLVELRLQGSFDQRVIEGNVLAAIDVATRAIRVASWPHAVEIEVSSIEIFKVLFVAVIELAH